MAKGNPFLGTVSGSFGDLTLKNYRGKQVLTRKSTKPHNPRTSKQIYQRMFFATVGKARAAFKNIIDHSFEHVPHGVDSLNYFQKRNIALLREGTVYDYAKQTWVNPNMNFVAPKSSYFTANPYLISEGSLSPVSDMPAFLSQNPEGWDPETDSDFELMIPAPINFPKSSEDGETLIQLIVDSLDMQQGDFLTLVYLSAKKEFISNVQAGSNIPTFVHYIRFKCVLCQGSENGQDFSYHLLIPTAVDGTEYNIPDVFDVKMNGGLNFVTVDDPEGSRLIPYTLMDNGNSADQVVIVNGNRLVLTFPDGLKVDEDVVVAATWIHSRPDDENILTSTQYLKLADPQGTRIPFNLDLESAFNLWTKQGKAIGDARYLLEGGEA